MNHVLEISVLGGLRVLTMGAEVPLPASKKARALLAFLVTTGRPHRRDRLCEMFWDLPDDPKAALRWALTKLRKVLDTPDRVRIVADRERVGIDDTSVTIDLRDVRNRLRSLPEELSLRELEETESALAAVVLDGLDGAGNDSFELWLTAERQDAVDDRIKVLRLLADHPQASRPSVEKWLRLLREADPFAEIDDPGQRPGERQQPAAALEPGTRRAFLRQQKIGFCKVRDRTKIAFATLGSGPPLVKAANWLTHIEHDWDTPIWGACFADIASDRTFVRYDERGCGLSDWDVHRLDFGSFVDDLEAVVDKLGLERFPLLGISQGAAVSIAYAVRHPERVSGLILIGGYASGWRQHADEEEVARRNAVRQLTEVGWGTDNPAYRHIFSQTFMPDAAPGDLVWFDEFQRLTTSPANAARFQDAFGDIDVRDMLHKVRAPTLVLHARDDQRIPVEQGRLIASSIPGARFVELESKNHVLVEYEPAWKACMGHIRDFLHDTGI
ncbi:MAG: alpha/beta fold hydrolase [Rhizobiaceae bacterium]|nr:alpha/beta fold hydrolase [Rhizobiaceae bacterium]